EDTAAVFVRDPALTPVADRLDHGDAHVSGGLLDRVDHRLDALADDDCFDLDHWSITSLLRSIRTVSRQRPSRLAMRRRTPTTRNPTRWCSFRDASFSGKIEVWIVQIPAASLLAISSCIRESPMPRPWWSRST